jgi:hypothetical protein
MKREELMEKIKKLLKTEDDFGFLLQLKLEDLVWEGDAVRFLWSDWEKSSKAPRPSVTHGHF